MKIDNDSYCSTCAWFSAKPSNGGKPVKKGMCAALPPVYMGGNRLKFTSWSYPIVHKNSICSKWKDANEVWS